MYEGDIVVYNMDAYGADVNVILKILSIETHAIKVKPVDGWPAPFENWCEVVNLSPRFVIDYVYTIAPRTPPR
jgi:hypothetical protein